MFYGGDKMIEFPAAATIHRRLPKEAFYKHLPLTKVLKEKFVSDVDRIIVENSFTKEFEPGIRCGNRRNYAAIHLSEKKGI